MLLNFRSRVVLSSRRMSVYCTKYYTHTVLHGLEMEEEFVLYKELHTKYCIQSRDILTSQDSFNIMEEEEFGLYQELYTQYGIHIWDTLISQYWRRMSLYCTSYSAYTVRCTVRRTVYEELQTKFGILCIPFGLQSNVLNI